MVAAHVSLICAMRAAAVTRRRSALPASAARRSARWPSSAYDALKAEIFDFQLAARRPLHRDRDRRSASA